MDEFVARIHQFTDGFTGHTNIEYFKHGVSYGVYAGNTNGVSLSGLTGGVYDESEKNQKRIANNPAAHSFVDLSLTELQINTGLSFANDQMDKTRAGLSDYNALCGNCVNFLSASFGVMGMDPHSTANYLKDGTLVDAYAQLSDFLCTNDFFGLMESEYSWTGQQSYMHDVYGSFYGVSGSYMSWTGQYLDFYSDLRALLGNSTWDNYIEWMNSYYGLFGSPLAIDMNGDGIQTISLNESAVRFDITGDKVSEYTGWLSGEDAFLVRDLNKNGVIDDVGEMFGGLNRGEGYAELALLDSNGDGFVSAGDNEFNNLLLWQDKNTDGKTNKVELIQLSEVGIDSLDLNFTNSNVNQNGNLIGEVSSAKGEHVSVQMADIYFRYLDSSIDKKNLANNDNKLTLDLPRFDDLFGGENIIGNTFSDHHDHVKTYYDFQYHYASEKASRDLAKLYDRLGDAL